MNPYPTNPTLLFENEDGDAVSSAIAGKDVDGGKKVSVQVSKDNKQSSLDLARGLDHRQTIKHFSTRLAAHTPPSRR